MQFEGSEWDQAIKTTIEGARIQANTPLYYSYTTISEKDRRIFATHAEVDTGSQPWDLDPLIFFRIKKPTKSIDKLPKIDLSKYFKQATSMSTISFNISVENKDSNEIMSLVKELKFIEIEDVTTNTMFKQVVNFTEAQDREIHQQIDSQIVKLDLVDKKVGEINPTMFTIAKSELSAQSQLKDFMEQVLQMRMTFLIKYS